MATLNPMYNDMFKKIDNRMYEFFEDKKYIFEINILLFCGFGNKINNKSEHKEVMTTFWSLLDQAKHFENGKNIWVLNDNDTIDSSDDYDYQELEIQKNGNTMTICFCD